MLARNDEVEVELQLADKGLPLPLPVLPENDDNVEVHEELPSYPYPLLGDEVALELVVDGEFWTALDALVAVRDDIAD